jgi:uncharacterized protein
MILEGVVTTVSPSGAVNVKPMGPAVEPGMTRFALRPFRTSQTYRNLVLHGEGVLHVTDDVLLLAKASVNRLETPPPLRAAERVAGWVLCDACRYYEFRVVSRDDSGERSRLEAEVVHVGRLRDFFGFNRAKHAVLEAAILATRTALLPINDIEVEYRKLAVLVEKTGGAAEREAFAFLQAYLEEQKAAGPGGQLPADDGG